MGLKRAMSMEYLYRTRHTAKGGDITQGWSSKSH